MFPTTRPVPWNNAVSVMNHESVSFIARYTFSKLPQRPLGGGVARHIEMKEFSRTDFHNEEDI